MTHCGVGGGLLPSFGVEAMLENGMTVERLPVPFFRQLRDQGRSDADLEMAATSLRFARRMFNSRIDFDGGPTISHFIGAGSIAAQLELPIEYVCFAMLHNLYRSGDFPDGDPYGASPARRELTTAAVGSTIEEMIFERYSEIYMKADRDFAPGTHGGYMELCDLADLYEKYEDGRIYAAEPGRADRKAIDANRATPVRRARVLAGDRFADILEEALHREPDIPPQAMSGTVYGWYEYPHSGMRRPSITVRQNLKTFRRRVAPAWWFTRRQGHTFLRRSRKLARIVGDAVRPKPSDASTD